MTPIGLAGLALAAASVAAGAGLAFMVVTTSGPFASDNDTQTNAVVASPTPTQAPGGTSATPTPSAATPTPTPTPSPVTRSPTPTPGPATPSPTAAVRLDPDGWPIVTCPTGTGVVRARTRKLTVCGPVGNFLFRDNESDGVTGGPTDQVKHTLAWYNGDFPDHFLAVQIISRSDSPYTRQDFQTPCQTAESTGSAVSSAATFLGHAADKCVILSTDAGKPVVGNNLWGIEVFVETRDYWLIGDAAGRQFGAERDAAIEVANALFTFATANGLDRVP